MRKTNRNARSHRRYRAWRRQVMLDECLCRRCRRAGRTVAAVELHHIVPFARRPEGLMDLGNVEPLCWACHDEATRKVTADRRAWENRIADIQRVPRTRGDRPGFSDKFIVPPPLRG